VTNSLAATLSDNTAASLMGSYTFGTLKFLGGYEYIQYDNAKTPLPAGTYTIGGYNLAYVSNTAYPHPKILNVYWAGVRYTAMPGLDLTAAYYGYHQNSYGTGANAHCDTTVAGTCSGTFDGISFDADYAFTKRFDAYVGAMYTTVYNGVANGYTYQRNNIDPTIGVRFKF
jgi:predicted porin